MPRFSRRALALLALGAVLIGCNGLNTTKPSGGLPAPAVGDPVPETAGTDTDGQNLTLADYRGKVVMLSFWASY